MKSIRALSMLITLVFTNRFVYTQNSFPTSNENPSWNVYTMCCFGLNYETQTFQYIYDTVFCGQQYSKLISTPPSWPALGVPPIFLRVAGDKIFFRKNTNCGANELLMYDFSLSIGDTAYCAYAGSSNSTAFILSSIDTVNYFGVSRQRFHMTCPNYVNMNWIKGIGSPSHPFHPLACFSDNCEMSYALLCYDSSSIQLYQNPSYSTCNITGVDNPQVMKSIAIYPNPVNDKINISIVKGIQAEAIELYDFYWKLIKSFPAQNSVLNVDDLSSGQYFLKIRSSESIHIEKIIKN